jgi:DNA-binding transcriptional LysR family regulator
MFQKRQLPLLLAMQETPQNCRLTGFEARLSCDSFLEVKAALMQTMAAAFLPQFLTAAPGSKDLLRLEIPNLPICNITYSLAWNPRLLRLNPHAVRMRDAIKQCLQP